jgi:hypothetical protein
MSQPASESADTDPPNDPRKLTTMLQSVAARLGKTPTVVEVHDAEDCPYEPQQYVETFGSWDDALREAGLDPGKSSQKIPDHELLAELQRLYSDLGRSPTCEDMRDHGAYSDTLYKNRFGSWNDALQQAMLDTNELDDAELLRELVRVDHDIGRVPTAEEMREYGEYRPVTYHRRFGSWRKALAEADFS